MAESVNNGGRNRPLEAFCPTFCSKQGQADQVAQGSMQGNCEHLHGGGLHRFSLCTCSDLLQKAEDSSVCRCCLDGKTEDALGKASASHFVALCPHSLSISLKQIGEAILVSTSLHRISVIQASVKHMQPAQVIQ